MKTSKTSIFLRACFGVFLIYLVLGWLWNFAADQSTWSVTEMAICAVATVAIFGSWSWAFTRILMWFVYSENSHY